MVNIYNEFNTELVELRNHLKYVQNIENDLPTTSPLYKYIKSSEKRKFNYKALVISLYGIIEKFSEKFLTKYLELISTDVPNYESVKDKIKDVHLSNSATLTLKVIENKHQKYSSLDAKTIVKNLYSCINNDSPYIINKTSFTLASGNLKHSKICDLYKQVDINIEQMFDKFTTFKNITSEKKYNKIDEIVDRRNEIAHGSLSSILDSSEFPDYIDFVEKYFEALYYILDYDLNQEKYKYILKYHTKEIENITIYPGNIIGFKNTKRFWFFKNQKILVEKLEGGISDAKIESFKIYKQINGITIKLKPKTNLKPNQKFYYITNRKYFR